MADLEKDMASESRDSGRVNMNLWNLLKQFVLHGREGFSSRKQVSIYKRVMMLTREVAAFLAGLHVDGEAVRLLCAVVEHLLKMSWKKPVMWERSDCSSPDGRG